MRRPVCLGIVALSALAIIFGASCAHMGTEPVATAPRWQQVSAGDHYTCATTDDGRAFCWGSNYHARFGSGDTISSGEPVRAAAGLNVALVSTDGEYTCFTTRDGAAYCSGYGNADPADMGSQIVFSSVVAGFNFFILGLGRDGKVYDLSSRGVARPTVAPYVPAGELAVALTSGGTFAAGMNLYHTCVLTDTGTAYCYSADAFGDRGDGPGTHPTGTPVSGGFRFASISGDSKFSAHVCGIATDGSAYCWGENGLGQLGSATAEQCIAWGHFGADTVPCSTTPVAVAGDLKFRSLDVGTGFTCGITVAGSGYCWGDNEEGQLGNGTVVSSGVPVPVAGGIAFTSISAGWGHACGVTPDAEIYCWGAGEHGQLGQGTRTGSTIPVRVSKPLN